MAKIRYIHIDTETFSSVDLTKCGVYKYAESEDFEVLLFGYSVDGGEVKAVDLASGEEIPTDIKNALTDPTITKYAHNANFERVCLSRFLHLPPQTYLPPQQWKCTMTWAAYMGLPLSLKGVGEVLGLERKKMEEGKELIRYFCVPCKPTKSNGGRTRNRPEDAQEKWDLFVSYNKRDVEVEMQIEEKLKRFPVPDDVWKEYWISEEINDRGIKIDEELVENAIRIDGEAREELKEKMTEITELENPNSVIQLMGWLEENGVEATTLGKKNVKKMVEEQDGDVKEVLQLRQQLAKSSVKKYVAMENAVCGDGRIRGCFMFYGANRTGRFSGKLVQLQNLPQNHLPDLAEARELVRRGDTEALHLLYSDIPDTLSQLIRTAFIASPGNLLYVADFSAIEARVLSWLAGEQWRMDAFENGEDIYCASASQMFGVPVVKHGVNGELRQKGKVAELACIAEGQMVLTDRGEIPIEEVSMEDKVWDGEEWVNHDGVVYKGEREVITYDGLTATPDHLIYSTPTSTYISPVAFSFVAGEKAAVQGRRKVFDILNCGPRHRFTVEGFVVSNCGYGGGVGALKAMGAEEMGLTDEELSSLVRDWRNASPNIVRFWWVVDRAAKKAVFQKEKSVVRGITFSYQSGFLFITLPSGRTLAYVKPRKGVNKFGEDSITYEGVGGTKKWERLETYGPKIVENLCQAISRDILCYAMSSLREMGICMHIHDELVIEAPAGTSLEEICEVMGRTPPWAEGLMLRADGYVTPWYKKD